MLAASEPRDCASEPMELPALSAADAMEAASPVSEFTAALPPLWTALPMEVASAAAAEPRDCPFAAALEAMESAAETIESTLRFWAVAVERRRAVLRRVNFILVVVWSVDEVGDSLLGCR